MDPTSLILPTFIAGILTFLAPCTLPLIPGYLGFISGVSTDELQNGDKTFNERRKIFQNGLLYMIGFSSVFILLGSMFGVVGASFNEYRPLLSRIGGIFIIFFGLYMMKIFHIKLLDTQRQISIPKRFKPGTPVSSFLFGATFAFGWTPCVGPILGSVFTLASSSTTVEQGALLLGVFSLGLGIPFLLVTLGISSATTYIHKFNKHLNLISFIGGIFLVFLGILLLTDNFNEWLGFFYRNMGFLQLEWVLDYM